MIIVMLFDAPASNTFFFSFFYSELSDLTTVDYFISFVSSNIFSIVC